MMLPASEADRRRGPHARRNEPRATPQRDAATPRSHRLHLPRSSAAARAVASRRRGAHPRPGVAVGTGCGARPSSWSRALPRAPAFASARPIGWGPGWRVASAAPCRRPSLPGAGADPSAAVGARPRAACVAAVGRSRRVRGRDRRAHPGTCPRGSVATAAAWAYPTQGPSHDRLIPWRSQAAPYVPGPYTAG